MLLQKVILDSMSERKLLVLDVPMRLPQQLSLNLGLQVNTFWKSLIGISELTNYNNQLLL